MYAWWLDDDTMIGLVALYSVINIKIYAEWSIMIKMS